MSIKAGRPPGWSRYKSPTWRRGAAGGSTGASRRSAIGPSCRERPPWSDLSAVGQARPRPPRQSLGATKYRLSDRHPVHPAPKETRTAMSSSSRETTSRRGVAIVALVVGAVLGTAVGLVVASRLMTTPAGLIAAIRSSPPTTSRSSSASSAIQRSKPFAWRKARNRALLTLSWVV